MAKYTIELYKLIASGYDIGLLDYPIFDETYRTVLNKLITDHFYFREIGAETPAVFKLYLERTMAENMPYFNQLYLSGLLTFDPLHDYHMDETTKRTIAGTSAGAAINAASEASESSVINSSTGASTTNVTNHDEQVDDKLSVESGTPAGLLAIADIKTNTYASKADRQDNTVTGDGTTENIATGTSGSDTGSTGAQTTSAESTTSNIVESTDDYIRTVAGVTGRKTASEMLLNFRKTIINIDIMVLDILETCFMGVW